VGEARGREREGSRKGGMGRDKGRDKEQQLFWVYACTRTFMTPHTFTHPALCLSFFPHLPVLQLPSPGTPCGLMDTFNQNIHYFSLHCPIWIELCVCMWVWGRGGVCMWYGGLYRALMFPYSEWWPGDSDYITMADHFCLPLNLATAAPFDCHWQ